MLHRFKKQVASETTGIENQGQTSDFLKSCNIRGAVGKMSQVSCET